MLLSTKETRRHSPRAHLCQFHITLSGRCEWSDTPSQAFAPHSCPACLAQALPDPKLCSYLAKSTASSVIQMLPSAVMPSLSSLSRRAATTPFRAYPCLGRVDRVASYPRFCSHCMDSRKTPLCSDIMQSSRDRYL